MVGQLLLITTGARERSTGLGAPGVPTAAHVLIFFTSLITTCTVGICTSKRSNPALLYRPSQLSRHDVPCLKHNVSH